MTIEHILLRGGTAAEWTAANPVLMLREPGLELDTRQFKVGDGTTAWSSLPYFNAGGAGALALDDLTDVVVTSHAAGEVLQSNGTNFASVDVISMLTGILDTDVLLAADSNTKISTQHAVKTYTDTKVSEVEYEATFGFASPLTTWTISHGRGTKALSVETFNDAGDRMLGQIEYTDLNTITVSWYYPTSGSARVFS